MVDGQDEGRDGVTAIRALRRIAVDTAYLEVFSDERIGRALTDSCTDRIQNRFDDIQLDAPERPLAVDVGRIVMIETCTVQQRLLTVPVIDPNERQIGGANRCGGVYQRMNNQ